MQPLIADLDAAPLPQEQALELVRSACELAATRPPGQGLDLERLRRDLDADVAHDALITATRYLPPELVDDGVRPGPASDAYALGVLLFELLTGEAPGHEPPSAIVRELDPRLDALCAGLLAPHARRHPRSPRALLRALDGLTPLRPRLGLRPAPGPVSAGLGARALAGLLDVAPFLALAAFASPLAGLLAFLAADLLAGSLGASPGKRLLGLTVVDAAGRELDGPTGRKRTVARWLSWLSCGLGYGLALEPGGATLHDAIAGTAVVHADPLRTSS